MPLAYAGALRPFVDAGEDLPEERLTVDLPEERAVELDVVIARMAGLDAFARWIARTPMPRMPPEDGLPAPAARERRG
jgi:hypothetical protein